MSFRRTAGSLLSVAGVVLAALYAAPEPPYWCAFALSLAVLGLGLLLLQQKGNGERRGATVAVADSQQWARRLREAALRLEELARGRLGTEATEELDRLRLEVFVPFAEMRERLTTTLGLQRYADVMIAFARGERALNRGFSALVDGYPGEAAAALWEALQFSRQAADLLVAAS